MASRILWRSVTAPALPAPGTEPATITIVEDRANYVRVEVSDPGTLVLFASETGVLLTVNDGLDVLEAEAPVPVEGCPDDVPERRAGSLPAGALELLEQLDHNLKITDGILRHRIILSYEAEAEGISTDEIVTRVLERVPLDR